MLFNWVQPLFNRYAQRCAKGVTRVPLHVSSFFGCLLGGLFFYGLLCLVLVSVSGSVLVVANGAK